MENNNKWVNDLNISDADFKKWTAEKPKNVSSSYWCLKTGVLNASAYSKWAKNYYKLPLMAANYKEFKADISFWAQLKDVANWSEAMVPLYFWKNTLFVLVTEPIDNNWSFPVNYVLGTPEQMQFFWNKLDHEPKAQAKLSVVQESSVNTAEDKAIQSLESETLDNKESLLEPMDQNSIDEDLLTLDQLPELPEMQNQQNSNAIVTPKDHVAEVVTDMDSLSVTSDSKSHLEANTSILSLDDIKETQENIEDSDQGEKTNIISLKDFNIEMNEQQNLEIKKQDLDIPSIDNSSEDKTNIISLQDLQQQDSQKENNQTNVEASMDDLLNIENSGNSNKGNENTLDLEGLLQTESTSQSLNEISGLEGLSSEIATNPVSNNDSLLDLNNETSQQGSTDSMEGFEGLQLNENSVSENTVSLMPDLSVTTESLRLEKIHSEVKSQPEETKSVLQSEAQGNHEPNAPIEIPITAAQETSKKTNIQPLKVFSSINSDFEKSLAIQIKENQLFISHQDGSWNFTDNEAIPLQNEPCLFKFCMISKLPFHGAVSDNDSIKSILFKKLNITNANTHITLLPLVNSEKQVQHFVLSVGNKENLQALDKLTKLSTPVLNEIQSRSV